MHSLTAIGILINVLYLNPADHLSAEVVRWDASRYAILVPNNLPKPKTKASYKREALLRQRYPPFLNGIMASLPCIIVDQHSIILTWYLPGILTDAR